MARPHPAKAMILARGLTMTDVARAIGYERSVSPFCRVLGGHRESWPELRARVATFLGVDEHEAFHSVPRELDASERRRRAELARGAARLQKAKTKRDRRAS